MNIYFRTDASTSIGSGHLMRSLTLANELEKNGAKITFICSEETKKMLKLVKEKGFKVHVLPLYRNEKNDKEQTRNILRENSVKPDLLIIDHYGIDVRWESYIREFVEKIMIIDDIADKKHDCDIALNQNYTSNINNRYDGILPQSCIKLFGPKYALLRPEFCKATENLRERNHEVKRILVFMSGSDFQNMTSKVLKALQIFNRSDIAVDVIIGTFNKYLKDLEIMTSELANGTCYYNVDNMAEMMSAADLSIGAAGSTTWERCCMGLPSILVSLADNQIDILEALGKSGVVINLGWHEDVTEYDINETLENLIKKPSLLSDLSAKSRDMVDGKGAMRVAEEICRLIC